MRHESCINARNIMGRITERTGISWFKMFIFQGFQGCGYGEAIRYPKKEKICFFRVY